MTLKKNLPILFRWPILSLWLLVLLNLFPQVTWAAPRLFFPHTSFDFGLLDQNQKAEHIFILMNTGDQPLTIDKIKAPCGCTIVELTKKVVEPNESGEISIIFNPADNRGKIEKMVYVHSNDPEQPIVRLVIMATVQMELEISPQNLFFNQVKAGTKATKEVSIKNSGQHPVSILSVKTTHPSLSFKVAPGSSPLPVQLKPGDSYIIAVEIEGPSENEPMLMNQIIINTNSVNKPQITIPLTITSFDLLRERKETKWKH